jgi:hypothetical protein
LIVINHVDNNQIFLEDRNSNAPDFTLHINGNNTSPTDFSNSETGVDVQLAAGPYTITETTPITTNTGLQYSVNFSLIVWAL